MTGSVFLLSDQDPDAPRGYIIITNRISNYSTHPKNEKSIFRHEKKLIPGSGVSGSMHTRTDKDQHREEWIQCEPHSLTIIS